MKRPARSKDGSRAFVLRNMRKLQSTGRCGRRCGRQFSRNKIGKRVESAIGGGFDEGSSNSFLAFCQHVTHRHAVAIPAAKAVYSMNVTPTYAVQRRAVVSAAVRAVSLPTKATDLTFLPRSAMNQAVPTPRQLETSSCKTTVSPNRPGAAKRPRETNPCLTQCRKFP